MQDRSSIKRAGMMAGEFEQQGKDGEEAEGPAIGRRDIAGARAWQRMLSGRRLDLLNPDPADIEIEDIAHGLARVARWNGQTVGDHAFSVAEHCLFVVEILRRLEPAASPALEMAALLHDAPEYVIGDLISPFKAAIGVDYKKFELRILEAIHHRFAIAGAVDAEAEALIKQADGIAAYYEALQLAGFTRDEGEMYFSPPQPDDARFEGFDCLLDPLSVMAAEAAYLGKFEALYAALQRG